MKLISKEEFSPSRKEWPFKDLEIDKGVELSDGYNDCNLQQIAVAARTYAAKSNREFRVATVTKDGKTVIQVLRIK